MAAEDGNEAGVTTTSSPSHDEGPANGKMEINNNGDDGKSSPPPPPPPPQQQQRGTSPAPPGGGRGPPPPGARGGRMMMNGRGRSGRQMPLQRGGGGPPINNAARRMSGDGVPMSSRRMSGDGSSGPPVTRRMSGDGVPMSSRRMSGDGSVGPPPTRQRGGGGGGGGRSFANRGPPGPGRSFSGPRGGGPRGGGPSQRGGMRGGGPSQRGGMRGGGPSARGLGRGGGPSMNGSFHGGGPPPGRGGAGGGMGRSMRGGAMMRGGGPSARGLARGGPSVNGSFRGGGPPNRGGGRHQMSNRNMGGPPPGRGRLGGGVSMHSARGGMSLGGRSNHSQSSFHHQGGRGGRAGGSVRMMNRDMSTSNMSDDGSVKAGIARTASSRSVDSFAADEGNESGDDGPTTNTNNRRANMTRSQSNESMESMGSAARGGRMPPKRVASQDGGSGRSLGGMSRTSHTPRMPPVTRNNLSRSMHGTNGSTRSGMMASTRGGLGGGSTRSMNTRSTRGGLGAKSASGRTLASGGTSFRKGMGGNDGASVSSRSLLSGSRHSTKAHEIFEDEHRTLTQKRKDYIRELKKEIEGPRCTGMMLLVWGLTTGELMLDMVTTIIAFVSFLSESECCEEQIDLGRVPMGIAIPYFLLIVVELGLLVASIKMEACSGKRHNPDEEEEDFDEDEDGDPMLANRLMRWLGWCVLVNPFFGCLVCWGLLYQSSKAESFVVLGLEGGALLLQWAAAYLEGVKLTRTALCIHMIPIVPFTLIIIVTLIYLHKGGVCYRNGTFWYDGCVLCDDGQPSSWDGKCGEGMGDGTHHESYCTPDFYFCWFNYDNDPNEIPLRY